MKISCFVIFSLIQCIYGFIPPVSLKSSLLLRMNLRTLSNQEINQILPFKVTNDQWLSFWGVNQNDRLQRILESVLISYGGAWLAWFLSFMAGSFVSGIVGSLLIFNFLYTPWLNAKKYNNACRSRHFSYGLFETKIHSLKRLKRRGGRTIGAVAQEFIRIITEDEKGRYLEIVTEWQDVYDKLRIGMTLYTVIVSNQPGFKDLVVVTDGWVPSCEVWVGDYPYLVKNEFRQICKSMSRVTKRQVVSNSLSNDNKVFNTIFDDDSSSVMNKDNQRRIIENIDDKEEKLPMLPEPCKSNFERDNASEE